MKEKSSHLVIKSTDLSGTQTPSCSTNRDCCKKATFLVATRCCHIQIAQFDTTLAETEADKNKTHIFEADCIITYPELHVQDEAQKMRFEDIHMPFWKVHGTLLRIEYNPVSRISWSWNIPHGSLKPGTRRETYPSKSMSSNLMMHHIRDPPTSCHSSFRREPFLWIRRCFMALLDREISSRSPVYQGPIYQGVRVRVRVALALLILALDPEE
ncbi:hypothetical protein HZ326_6004 [Fusarium oxysporum f. sp. albedinis]|nr:hypothetical protein HZ326_6004 [Fusarium oxysporum f. sp. albedinis]